jgi:hypothetical protein
LAACGWKTGTGSLNKRRELGTTGNTSGTKVYAGKTFGSFFYISAPLLTVSRGATIIDNQSVTESRPNYFKIILEGKTTGHQIHWFFLYISPPLLTVSSAPTILDNQSQKRAGQIIL